MEHVTTHGAPHRALLLSEPGRAAAELGSYLVSAPLLRRAPHGDGHSVIVLPGFLAEDRSTIVLRQYLGSLGYRTFGWGLGSNIGPTREILDGMEDLLTRTAEASGRPVSIVGWSLGGMFARALGRDHAEKIRRIITLGSPFRSELPIGSHATKSFELLAHRHVPHTELPAADSDREPLDVPVCAIYTKADGVVAWQSCLQDEGHGRENIEVRGSHCGLGHNPAALWVVADRLAQPASSCEPFSAPLFARRLFPTPATLAAA